MSTGSAIADAIRSVAVALHRIAIVMEKDFEKRYPAKAAPRDATVSTLKTPEERLREDQGQTGEPTLTDWTAIGWREQEVLDREARADADRKTGNRVPALPGEAGDFPPDTFKSRPPDQDPR